jgi:hypothetical protein
LPLLDPFFLGFLLGILLVLLFLLVLLLLLLYYILFFSIRVIRILNKAKTLEITKFLVENIIANKNYNIIRYPRNRLKKKEILVFKFFSNLNRYRRFSNNRKYKKVLIITNIN